MRQPGCIYSYTAGASFTTVGLIGRETFGGCCTNERQVNIAYHDKVLALNGELLKVGGAF